MSIAINVRMEWSRRNEYDLPKTMGKFKFKFKYKYINDNQDISITTTGIGNRQTLEINVKPTQLSKKSMKVPECNLGCFHRVMLREINLKLVRLASIQRLRCTVDINYPSNHK